MEESLTPPPLAPSEAGVEGLLVVETTGMLLIVDLLIAAAVGVGKIGEEGKDCDLPETAVDEVVVEALELIEDVRERVFVVAPANASVAGEKFDTRRSIF